MMTLLPLRWLAAALVLAFAALFLYIAWVRWTDARFGVSRRGGRGGEISIRFATYVARTEYEIGGTVDLIVYSGSFVDSGGQLLAESQQTEALERLRAWARTRRLSLDIAAFRPVRENGRGAI